MFPWLFSKWEINLLDPFLLALGQKKYLIEAIDYFTKWVEAKPLPAIIADQARKFTWRNIFTHIKISKSTVIDNGTQFIYKKFRYFLVSYKVKHHFTLVKHPQANGQVKVTNKVFLQWPKKRLNEGKGAWADKLGSILLSYQTIPQLTTGETPFKLTYGVDAMVRVEIEKPILRVILRATNFESIREEINKPISGIRSATIKFTVVL